MSVWTQDTLTAALYECGLKPEMASEVAATAPVNIPTQRLPSSLYYAFLERSGGYWFVESTSEFQALLRTLKFRDEVIPRATFADIALQHGDARQWVERFAERLYPARM
ncbi:hypothetical protein EUX98_g7472 [Antrodiella citrinella]|uniref:Uncharacterized protein n=1 Tax=Antrodiella citrinella TaxID=2447956 RepID=A0A4S4MM07_9APHY|nr:hypothetical protein EUX98_g7472 [Antrodiella citrinella]